MDWRQSLKRASWGTFAGMADDEMWGRIGLGILAVVVLLLRIVFVLTYPISTPIIAWLLILDERKRDEQVARRRAKMRAGMHQNGPGA